MHSLKCVYSSQMHLDEAGYAKDKETGNKSTISGQDVPERPSGWQTSGGTTEHCLDCGLWKTWVHPPRGSVYTPRHNKDNTSPALENGISASFFTTLQKGHFTICWSTLPKSSYAQWFHGHLTLQKSQSFLRVASFHIARSRWCLPSH